MTITYGTSFSGTNKTAGVTTVATGPSSITLAASSLVMCVVAADNIGSGSAAPCAITDNGTFGGTWTQLTGSPVSNTLAAAAGASLYVFWLVTTVALNPGTFGPITATFSGGTIPTAKVIDVLTIKSTVGFGSTEAAVIESSVITAFNGGTPSVTRTPSTTGQLAYGVCSSESDASPTGDADTTNGSWDSLGTPRTTGGSAVTNIGAYVQGKIVTAAGSQTWNPTTTADCVAGLLVITEPLVAPVLPRTIVRQAISRAAYC